jgi:hypothetical protein
MADVPIYNFSQLSGDGVAQLGQYEDILTDAHAKGIVNYPPANASETYDIESQRIRLQTFSSRLHLLGYLRHKISPKKIDKHLEDIKAAVLQFQADANLKQDSWVGNKTWYALDQLVSFESEFTYEQWFENDQIKPEVQNAMHRAIQLRLYSLGLYGTKPNRRFKLLNKASLSKLGKILRILLIKQSDFKADFNFETLKALFDQDLLTSAIARSSGRFLNSFPVLLSRAEKEADKGLAQKFIISCAKVELWLLGYEVKIGSPIQKNEAGDYSYELRGELWRAMFEYYQQYEGKERREARKLAANITPRLFKSLDDAAKRVDDYETDDASEEVFEALKPKTKRERKSFLSRAWGYLKEKGMRLWDGLKRIWRWIKKIGKKIFSFLQKNLFKAFYRFTSKAFKIITKGISRMVKSVKIYIRGILPSQQMAYVFSKDMDCTPYFEKSISLENVDIGVQKIQRQTKAFTLVCKIIGFAVHFFKNLSIGVLGWAKLLFSLLKSFKKIKVLYRDLKSLALDY